MSDKRKLMLLEKFTHPMIIDELIRTDEIMFISSKRIVPNDDIP